MSSTATYPLRPVGAVRSSLTAGARPKQGSEGAPEAWVEIDPAFGKALDGIAAGQDVGKPNRVCSPLATPTRCREERWRART
jgi:hypothetical protein